MNLPRCLEAGPVQMAYGVDDLSAAVHAWEEAGAGPFIVREHIPVDPASFDHSSAYGWWGGLMVELVQIHSPAALARPGLHHLAFFVESFERASAELTACGWPAVLNARAGATRFAFHDATESLGHYVEIYEGSDGLREFYDHVRELHIATGHR